MSKLARKLNKRIMAIALSVAMVMSNMTVYASELTGPQVENTVDEAVVDAEDTSVTPDDAATSDESSETGAVVDETNGETVDTPDDETTGDVTGDDVQTPDTGEEGSSDDGKGDEAVTDEEPSEDGEEVNDEVNNTGSIDWENIEAPEITNVEVSASTITVSVKGVVDPTGAGADLVTVKMYNSEHTTLKDPQPIDTKESSTPTGEDKLTTLTFTPSSSGSYAFKAFLSRKDTVDDKTSEFSSAYVFKIALDKPEITTLMNIDAVDGKGGITATWKAISEADYYILSAKSQTDGTIKSTTTVGTSAEVSDLTIDDRVDVTVIAYRENAEGEDPDASEVSVAKEIKITGVMPKAYTFDAEDYELGKQAAGTKLGTEDYFTLMLDSKLGGSGEFKSAAAGKYIEISKNGSAGIQFTVYGTADASFSVACTNSSSYSPFGLMNSEGKLVEGSITGTNGKSEQAKVYESDTENRGPAYHTYGGTTSSIDYKDLPAGTYTFLAPFSEYNRGGRVHSIIVYDDGAMPPRGTWSSDRVGTPIISNIKYVKGEATIKVTASGYVGYYGADSLMLEMLDSKGVVVETIVKALDSTFDADGNRQDADLEYVFTPKASDDYSFRASLVRNGEANIYMTDDVNLWKVEKFVLPLATPSVGTMTNMEDDPNSDADTKLGSLEVIFSGVDEADYYIVAALSGTKVLETEYVDVEDHKGEDKLGSVKASNKEYTVTLKGLPLGDCYVTAQAFRNTDSSLVLDAKTTTLTRVPAAGDEAKDTVDKKEDSTLGAKIEELRQQEGNADKSYEILKEQALQALSKAVAPADGNEDGKATAVVRSKAFMPSASKYVNGKNATRWSHSVFGSNTSRSTYSRPIGLNRLDGEYDTTKEVAVPQNGYYEEVYKVDDKDPKPEGKDYGDLKSVTVWSENGRGKVVPASTDGLSYYYTSVNPSENNFTLSALIHLKSWKYSNGQDGFGIMVSDTVGKDGDDGNTWTNAYQLLASKIQYSWVRATVDEKTGDYIPGYVTNAPGNGTTIMRYEMKLGVGWNAKEGAKASDVAKINSGALTSPVNFSTSSGTLESSAGEYNNGVGRFTGSYNVVGNAFGDVPESSVADDKDLLTDFRFQVQKYDNAYVLRYLAVNATAEADKDANKQYQEISGSWYELLGEQVFSDDNNNKLTQIDKNNVYVGFFAARNARIGVSDINLNVTTAGDDDYVIPTTSVDPSVTISSMEASNDKNYDLALNTNFDGTLTIYKEYNGKKTAVTTGKAITAGTKYTFTTPLDEGTTKFTCHAQPNENYVPGENQVLSNFNMQNAEISVTYHAFKGDTIYVAPNGALMGLKEGTTDVYAGSAEYPTNVYDAVNYAKVGQTIILKGGVYKLTTDAYNNDEGAANLLIGKKHDGTPKSYITMRAATAADGDFYNAEAGRRPVLDFGQKTQRNDTAFIIAGNYWRFEGFDVMGSKDGQKGILLGGSHNILSDLRTYLNGNTGIQVARYSNDGRSEWPSYNTIINCSSFLNYDAGYEDADGFAAKLTCGDGNRFIGCIAAYNADDGWDLFAKVESGSIGVVTIENCLAFKNGYLFGVKNYYPATGADLVYRYTDFSRYTKSTSVLSAGNGNGFKMGGDSMSGYHVLRNSIAFGNKSKGIDSNSCPDIQVYNSISFNNEANNVALYTGAAVNTDYYVENLISIKDSSCANGGASTTENIAMKGTQNRNKIYSSSNYFWSGSKSVNADGAVFDTSKFGHMIMNNAIFGKTAICRKADGSIDLKGFLTIDGESNIGGTDPDVTLDKGADIYVFAAEYSKSNAKLSDIKLSEYDATKALAADGYDWVDGTILIAAYAGSSVDFTVTNGTYNKNVTVNFIQLTDAELQVTGGDNNNNGVLDATETWTVEAVPVIAPAVEPDVALSGFKAEIKETSRQLLKIENKAVGTVNANLNVADAKVTVNGNDANGSAKMTATITLTAGGRTVKKTAVLAFTVTDKVGIKFDTIDPDPTAEDSKIVWDGGDDIGVAMNGVTTFTMKNLHFTKIEKDAETGEEKESPDDFGSGVTIKVNDASVIKLKSTASSANGVDATFEVVNKSGDGGTATVTVTSKKDKSLVRNYIVTVSGREFAWNSSLVTIDKAKTVGVQLAALAPFGRSMNGVNSITVAAVYKGAKVTKNALPGSYNEYFEANKVTDGVYELNTAAAVAGPRTRLLPNGTYTVVYQAEVNADEPKIEFTPITIKVIETKPTVTFRQTKRVNLFYKNGTDGSTGKLTASSRQAAVTMTVKGSETNGNDYFRFSSNGAGYDIVSINKNPVTLNKNTGAADFRKAKQNSRLTLHAHFEGYYDAYDLDRPFSVAVEYRQPRLKLTALDNTIYTAIGMDGADILIYDPDSEMYLSPDVATIELVTNSSNRKAYSKANTYFTLGDIENSANSGNGVRLIPKNKTVKGGTVKLSIKYDDWFSEASVIVSQNIRVNSTKPRMTIRPAKLNINTVKFVGNEQASSPIILTGAKGFTIDSFELEGTNEKSRKMLDFVDYELSTDINGNNVLLLSLKEKDDEGNDIPVEEVKRGIYTTYKMKSGYPSSCSFKVKYTLGTDSAKTEPMTTNFKISLVSKEKLTVAVKGSINIIDRVNSTVTFKPKMTNFTPSQVADVELTGDAANLFMVADFDKSTGVATIKAKDTVDLKKGSYKVYPVYTFDLGVAGTASMTTDRPVVIKTTQSNLKIAGLKDVLEVKLSSPDTAAQRTITVAPSGAYITDLTQISGLENFTLTYTGDGVEVTINNRAGLKEGKTYRITALINVEGSASNVKKQQISIPVKVIR